MPPGTRPGWIVAVTSVHERTWNIAVTSDDHRHIFHVWVVESIPWEYYVGTFHREQYSIYDGDDPYQAICARAGLDKELTDDKIKKTL